MLQCSTSWAMKTHTWGAGQFIEFILTPYFCFVFSCNGFCLSPSESGIPKASCRFQPHAESSHGFCYQCAICKTCYRSLCCSCPSWSSVQDVWTRCTDPGAVTNWYGGSKWMLSNYFNIRTTFNFKPVFSVNLNDSKVWYHCKKHCQSRKVVNRNKIYVNEKFTENEIKGSRISMVRYGKKKRNKRSWRIPPVHTKSTITLTVSNSSVF